jgi:type II secretory pathway predicted ATPase ExeA
VKRSEPAVAAATAADPSPSPFPYEDYVAARTALLRALRDRPFYALVAGASGMGKTSLLRDVAHSLDRHRHHVVYVSSSRASLVGIVRFLAQSLHVSPRRTYLETVQVLTEAIQAQTAHLLLWVDEAHEVDAATLQEVRMVAEADLGAEQILSVVLSGLPSLITQLDAPLLFPLKRRIALRLRLDGLRRDELDPFLVHRFGASQAQRVPVPIRDELFERTQAAPALIDSVVRQALSSSTENLDSEAVRVILDRQAL